MPALIVEFIGTFFLVLTLGLNVLHPVEGSEQFAPLAVGAVYLVVMFAGGHISGGHYNPAVSVGSFLRGSLKASDLSRYIATQAVAAVVAALVVQYFKGRDEIPAVDMVDASTLAFDAGRVILAEFLYTFLLVFTVLNVATARGTAGNSFYGLAAGFVLVAGTYSVGAISGGAFNPAVSLAACVVKIGSWSTLWAYFAPQLLAATCAAYVYKAVHPGEA